MWRGKNMTQSETIAALAEALAKAQGAITNAKKDVSNTFFKSKYADLPAIMDAARPHLSANGLSVMQTTEISADGNVTLVTQLSHSSGQWVRGFYPIKPVKQDPQGMGSAITYARRYTYSAIAGVASSEDDDDGNRASNIEPEFEAKPRGKSVFPTPRSRTDFARETIAELNAAASIKELNTIMFDKKERLEEMSKSTSETDIAQATDIRMRYKSLVANFKVLEEQLNKNGGWETEDPIEEPSSIAATDLPKEDVLPTFYKTKAIK